jgi:hypothetical protein
MTDPSAFFGLTGLAKLIPWLYVPFLTELNPVVLEKSADGDCNSKALLPA